jgi:hypothetical protein
MANLPPRLPMSALYGCFTGEGAPAQRDIITCIIVRQHSGISPDIMPRHISAKAFFSPAFRPALSFCALR